MHRLVSLLLIPLCLMGQFFCPHSHHGTGVAEPSGHSARPHIHLSGGHDHHHGHPHRHHSHGESDDADHPAESTVPESASPLTDHDRDALYLVNSSCDSRLSAVRVIVDFSPASGFWAFAPMPLLSPLSTAGAFDPPDRYGGLALYLRVSSLRI